MTIVKKNIKFLITLFILLGLSFHFNLAYAAGGSAGDKDEVSLYKTGKKLVLRAKKLEKKGFYVVPIRPPSVPPNSSRLRISITSSHSQNNIKKLFNVKLKIIKMSNRIIII